MSISAWPADYARIHFDRIDSTNDEARRRALAGEKGPLWIQADIQTSGRGRRGRVWRSPAGNLAATLLLTPTKPASEVAQLSFAAALGVSDALVRLAPPIQTRLKWPNDVLANNCKLAGILLESASVGRNSSAWLAIGIGINLAEHPLDTDFPATSLAALGQPVPEARVALSELAAAFAKWYDVWSIRGFSEVRDAWLSRTDGMGKRIKARLHDEEVSGIFEGIDASGALMLREPRGELRLIRAGDVFFQ